MSSTSYLRVTTLGQRQKESTWTKGSGLSTRRHIRVAPESPEGEDRGGGPGEDGGSGLSLFRPIQSPRPTPLDPSTVLSDPSSRGIKCGADRNPGGSSFLLLVFGVVSTPGTLTEDLEVGQEPAVRRGLQVKIKRRIRTGPTTTRSLLSSISPSSSLSGPYPFTPEPRLGLRYTPHPPS